jgi:hypothetical protein
MEYIFYLIDGFIIGSILRIILRIIASKYEGN